MEWVKTDCTTDQRPVVKTPDKKIISSMLFSRMEKPVFKRDLDHLKFRHRKHFSPLYIKTDLNVQKTDLY